MIRISDIYGIEKCRTYVNDVITSGWLTFTGKYVEECEKMLENILGVKHVLLTNNGTSATHCLIKSIKLHKPECKKIYVQNNCYIAVYNSILTEFNNDEIEVLPIDSETWNLDLNYLDVIEKNAALMIVHNLGNILPIDKIKEVRRDIIIVEDNCEGFMGKYNDKYSGTDSLASSLSFYANKHITCGEGGAFITNNTDLYNKIVSFTRQGVSSKKYIHTMHAYNYRITNINAAILLSQLEQLNVILEKKKEIYDKYCNLLKDQEYISLQKIEDQTIHSNWIFGIKILKDIDYDEIEVYFKNFNIEIRPFFYDIYKSEYLKTIHRKETKTNDMSIILLPIYVNLKLSDVDYIVNIIKQFISEKF